MRLPVTTILIFHLVSTTPPTTAEPGRVLALPCDPEKYAPGIDPVVRALKCMVEIPFCKEQLTIDALKYLPNALVLVDGGGNDVLFGPPPDGSTMSAAKGGGNDVIIGSADNKAATKVAAVAGGGNDVIYGGAGDRSAAVAGGGNDVIYGGAGDRSAVAGGGNDVIYGGAGDRSAVAGGGNDVIYGGAGDRSAVAGGGNDVIYGGDGDRSAIAKVLLDTMETAGLAEACFAIPKCTDGNVVEYGILIALRVGATEGWESALKDALSGYYKDCSSDLNGCKERCNKGGGGGGIAIIDAPDSCMSQDVAVVVASDVNPLVNKKVAGGEVNPVVNKVAVDVNPVVNQCK